MNWITTNIRFPEDLYMDLKMEAARKRKSVAALVREKVAKKTAAKANKQKDIKRFMRHVEEVAIEIAKQNPGINLSDELIKMRYEQ